MNDDPRPTSALLPAGLHDLLPPDAEAEARSVDALLEVFATYGYQRVEPPLLEFEDTLLAGSGQAVADQTFRVMDPASHRMMALRADITPQIARIATTRLARAPRPLRLSYAGPCLRLSGSELAPERQVSQVGIELIGHDSPEADAELVAVAAEALAAIGLHRVSFDLTMPRLVPALLDATPPGPEARRRITHALDRKDAAAVRADAGPLAETLNTLLLAAGRPERTIAALHKLDLPPEARHLAQRLEATVTAIETLAPSLTITLDPVESRGFRYHTGLCLTVFAPGRHEELGRGGRYLSDGEPASGLTLYADAVLRAAPPAPPRPRLYLPANASPAAARAQRAQGIATVRGLAPVNDPAAEAARLHCTAWLDGDTPTPLPPPLCP
jgi:ATP phosphoribosyltransferase regulatory subunit